jgi:hypothetical protein
MRSIRFVFAIIAGTIVLTGCGGPKYQFGIPEDAPDWVKKPPVEKTGYSFIGISAPGLTISTSRTQAEVRGRAGVGRVVESRVSQMNQDFREAAVEGSAVEGLSSSEMNSQDNVIRSVTKQTLSGAYVKEFWTNPKNGETFALTVLSKEDVLAIAKKELLEQGRRDRLYAQEKAGQALKELERIVDKEYNDHTPTEMGRD